MNQIDPQIKKIQFCEHFSKSFHDEERAYVREIGREGVNVDNACAGMYHTRIDWLRICFRSNLFAIPVDRHCPEGESFSQDWEYENQGLSFQTDDFRHALILTVYVQKCHFYTQNFNKKCPYLDKGDTHLPYSPPPPPLLNTHGNASCPARQYKDE